MHIHSANHAPWLRDLLADPDRASSADLFSGRYVGAPTRPGVVPASGADQLAVGPGGALAAMQMHHLRALQAQATFWTGPAAMAQAVDQLQQQGLGGGAGTHGWPEQVDPRELALLLVHGLINGGQLPNSSRSAGSLPSHEGSGTRVPGGWGPRASSGAPGSRPATLGSAPTGHGTSGDFLSAALAQNGDRYVYGAETRLDDADPHTFDCSELVQWAAHRAGVTIPDGSSNQLAHVRRHGTEISVEQALRTPGALLFRPGHVAISLGDGRTIEAKGRNHGVGVFDARGRFTSAGLIPGMRYN